MTPLRLLLILDASPASRRAIAYTARLVGGRPHCRLCLAHLLPPLPARLLAAGRADDPGACQRADAGADGARHRWKLAARRVAQRTFARTRVTLRQAGVPAGALDTQFFGPVDRRGVAAHIIGLARASRCHTIVVARESLPWFRTVVHADLSDELIRCGRGFTIWLIG
jgi:hypothetical protein